MNAKAKTVYYCDFCKKHGLSRPAMEKHERICTMNPARTCRWIKDDAHAAVDLSRLVSEVQSRAPLGENDLAWLHDELNGCPPCMLAALRQSGVEYHYDEKYKPLFWYDKAVEEFREREREEERQDEYRSLAF